MARAPGARTNDRMERAARENPDRAAREAERKKERDRQDAEESRRMMEHWRRHGNTDW